MGLFLANLPMEGCRIHGVCQRVRLSGGLDRVASLQGMSSLNGGMGGVLFQRLFLEGRLIKPRLLYADCLFRNAQSLRQAVSGRASGR